MYTIWLYTIPVALLLVERKGTQWTIRGTWVDKFWRQQGVGHLLLIYLLNDFWKEKPDCIWVNITNGAERFYTKYGFNIYGQRTDTPEPMSVGIYSNWTALKELEEFNRKFKIRIDL